MSSAEPTRATTAATTSAWASRPFLARCLRITAALLPTMVSFFVTYGLVQRLPPHEAGIPTGLWWIGLFVIGTVVLIATDKVARRLLPLVALFKLSLVFPDQAPSRYAIAMKTGTTKQLERRIIELKRDGIPNDEAQFATIMLELVASLSVHDRMTRGHCERVRAYTDLVIEEMGIHEPDASRLRWAALLHDVGKLFVDPAILNSPDRPTNAQWEELKSHTWQGDQLIGPLKPWLGNWHRAVGEHHERWDGDGYPSGLAGTDIHLGARIVAVTDAFDVMTSARSYKKPIPAAEARAEIARCAGGQFDPKVVRAFLNIGLGQLRLAIGPLAWLANIPAAGQAGLAPALSPIVTGATAAATVAVATISGGFGGAFVPDAEPPEALAFIETTTTEVAPILETPTSTTLVAPPAPTTTTSPATSTPTTAVAPRPTPAAPPTTATPTTQPSRTVPPTTPLPTTAPPTTAPPTTAPPRTEPRRANPPPQAFSIERELTEDGDGITLQLTATGTSNLTWRLVTGPTKGEVELTDPAPIDVADGALLTFSATLRYEPWADEWGTHSLVFEVCDADRRCDTSTVTFQIAATPDVPVASADILPPVEEDASADIEIALLLANDDDADGDALRVVSVDALGSGSAVLSEGGGQIRYTPGPDDDTEESLRYEVCDPSGRCDSAIASLDLLPINDTPAVNPISNRSTAVGDSVDFTVSGSDIEGDDFEFHAESLPAGLSIDATTGKITGTVMSAAGGTTHTVSIMAKEPGPDGPSSNAEAFDITVGFGDTSPLTQSLIISEMLYRSSPGVWDEFVEITNVGAMSIDLAGIQLLDNTPNPFLPGTWRRTLGSTDSRGAPSVLAPGSRAVIWPSNPNQIGRSFPDAPSTSLSYHGFRAGGPFADNGDDVWLVDTDGRTIDYVSYVDSGGGELFADLPSGHWVAEVPADLLTASPGQSISLAGGSRSDDPGCWERTGSGDAAGRCVRAAHTVQDNVVVGDTRVASVGRANYI